jgi:DNA polymerase epsilon subunit 1
MFYQLEYLRKELGGHWGEKLLNKVQQIAARAPTGSSHPDCQFPQLAGSHLTPEELGSPALAFVKTLCYLMGLDQELADEVRLLRRRLLRLLGVGEFTSDAVFKDPCISFKLDDVICR